jgi:hypothetical protein
VRKVVLLLAAAGSLTAALALVGSLGAAPRALGICPSPGTPHTDAEYEVVLGSGPSMNAVRPLVVKAAAFGFKNLEVEHGAGGYVVKLYGLHNRSLLSQELAEVHKTTLRVVRTDTVFRPCR